jgi:hypothetical protein
LTNGSSATFSFAGIGPDGITWTGEFTSQFNVPYQTVLAAFGPGGTNTVSNSYSGTITVSQSQVPEPATISMIGIALLAMPLGIKRFRKRQELNR